MPLFQSLTSFFGGGSSTSSSSTTNSRHHAARKSALSSTFDAFSLPTTNNDTVRGSGAGSRFGFGNGNGNGIDSDVGASGSASSSPGPSRRTSYAPYPPTKDTFNPSGTSYPPLSHTFHRLRNVLVDPFPELLETLNNPVNLSLLSSFERDLGCPLPPAVRDSFLQADGQDSSSFTSTSGGGVGGIFFGLTLLPMEEVIREWSFWRMAEHDPSAGLNPAVLATMASVPPGWIKSLYACRGWIPLLSDGSGNYVGVDLDPGHSGSWGQVIVFGRDFDRKCVLWKGEGEAGWGRWLASFVDDLESGESWESSAEKSNGSSDEEEEVGYGSYNGGQSYGESGGGIKLSGEYRGWNVLEAWWDRSVRKWEGLGLGLDVEEIERGLSEARRLAMVAGNGSGEGLDKGKGKGREVEGLGFGMGVGTSAAQVEIPVIGSPYLPARGPSTPVPGDDAALLPPTSPDDPPVIPTMRHPVPPPHSSSSHPPGPTSSTTTTSSGDGNGNQRNTPGVRIITPTPSSSTIEHPLRPRPTSQNSSGLLSPPSSSPPSRHGRTLKSIPPAPTPLDLPTRADVQAAQAVARAEQSGLRGGWVMNLDTSSSAGGGAGGAARRSLSTFRNSTSSRSGLGMGMEESEMVDIDLEGGKLERFGSPNHVEDHHHDIGIDSGRIEKRETEREIEREQVAIGMDLRRARGSVVSPQLGTTRTPSPLSRETSMEGVIAGVGRINVPSRLSHDYNQNPVGIGAQGNGTGSGNGNGKGNGTSDEPEKTPKAFGGGKEGSFGTPIAQPVSDSRPTSGVGFHDNNNPVDSFPGGKLPALPPPVSIRRVSSGIEFQNQSMSSSSPLAALNGIHTFVDRRLTSEPEMTDFDSSPSSFDERRWRKTTFDHNATDTSDDLTPTDLDSVKFGVDRNPNPAIHPHSHPDRRDRDNRDRTERERSVVSIDSQDGLLGSRAGSVVSSRRASVVFTSSSEMAAGGGGGGGGEYHDAIGERVGARLRERKDNEREEILRDRSGSEGLEDVDLR